MAQGNNDFHCFLMFMVQQYQHALFNSASRQVCVACPLTLEYQSKNTYVCSHILNICVVYICVSL